MTLSAEQGVAFFACEANENGNKIWIQKNLLVDWWTPIALLQTILLLL